MRKVESGKFLPVYKKLMAEEKGQLTAYCNKLSGATFQNLSNNQLIELVREYLNIYRQHGVVPIRTLNKVGTSIVENFLKKKFSVRDIAKIQAVLYSPSQSSVEQESDMSLLKISKQLKRDSLVGKEVTNKISSYLKKYAFIPCGYADENGYTVGDVKNKLHDMQSDIGMVKHIKSSQREQLIEELNLPSKLINLINALSEFTYYKDFIRMNYNLVHYYTQPLFQEVARRLSVSRKDLRYLTALEITAALEKGKVNKTIIKARKKFYVCFTDGKSIYIKVGQEAKILERQIDNKVTNKTELRGVVASWGKVEGVAKIVINKKNLKNWPPRAVMITPMTTPELVFLAKKSIAIVTDEGGITCHAAIISRELKLPCIIGTKIATKVFKDGDLVEVDANSGVVRKL